MKFRNLALAPIIAAAIALGAAGPAAADSPGNLGVLSAPSSRDLSNTIFGNGTVFSDVYSFSVTEPASFDSILTSVSFSNIFGITGFQSSLWLQGGGLLASGVTTTFGGATVSGINFGGLLAGTPPIYEIRVGGTVSGSFGNYSGGMSVAPIPMAPVPEPETYAMFLAGLGHLALAIRRRRRKQAGA